MATVWFNVFPASETQSGGNAPDGTRTVASTVGSAEYDAWMGNGTYGGWSVYTGPFDSASEAEADLRSAHPGPGSILGVVSGIALGSGNESPNAALNTGQAASSAASFLPGFLKGLTSRTLWVRIAEGALGLMLVIVAVAELGKGTAVGDAVKKVPFV